MISKEMPKGKTPKDRMAREGRIQIKQRRRKKLQAAIVPRSQ